MIFPYITHLLILFLIYLILALSLQLALGYGGMLNFSLIAFYGIGAYASSILTLRGLDFVSSTIVGGLLSALLSLALSIPINKLKGDYFALATMGFSYVIYAVLVNWTSLTNGPLGILNIPRPLIFNIDFFNNDYYLALTTLTAFVILLIVGKIIYSPVGLLLTAIRDDELASKILGKNSFKIKSFAFFVSAFMAGIAGSLFAHYVTYIDPVSFAFSQFIPIIVMVMVGGLASLRGTVLAVFILVFFPELFRFIDMPASILGPVRQMIYAIMLLLILYFRPKGLLGKIEI